MTASKPTDKQAREAIKRLAELRSKHAARMRTYRARVKAGLVGKKAKAS